MMFNKRIIRITVALIIICILSGCTKTEKETEYKNTQDTFELHTKADASYERWLAAAIVTAISMHYSEFEITGIYMAQETDLFDAAKSNGVYVTFLCEGETVAIYSKPLQEERTEEGTIDLYTLDLGFATFDEVDEKTIHIEEMHFVQVEELSELISQSMLVSLYER